MKKKVLITASVYTHIRNFHLAYIKEFHKLGWETHVACANIPDNVPYVDKAIDLSFKKRIISISNFLASWKLRSKIKSEQYDLIITHTALAAFFTRLAVKGMFKRPYLINVVHGYLFDDNTQIVKKLLFLNAELFTAPETDLLLLMNNWDLDTAQKYNLGTKIIKIPGTGVNFGRIKRTNENKVVELRAKLNIKKDENVVIYPAEFSLRKSQKVLIEALQYMGPKTKLILCGDGDTLVSCQKYAQEIGVEKNVIFPGNIEDIGFWYELADVCVSASRIEGLPHMVMEAMYMNIPVVASAVKGHVDLIVDGETGLLYPYGEAKQCAEKVQMILENRLLYKQITEKAAKKMSQYELDTVLPEVMKIYLMKWDGSIKEKNT